MTLTLRLSNSGLSAETRPSSVVQTGVKSLGCENSTPQLVPRHSWKLIGPSVVSAVKSGASSPSCSAMASSVIVNCVRSSGRRDGSRPCGVGRVRQCAAALGVLAAQRDQRAGRDRVEARQDHRDPEPDVERAADLGRAEQQARARTRRRSRRGTPTRRATPRHENHASTGMTRPHASERRAAARPAASWVERGDAGDQVARRRAATGEHVPDQARLQPGGERRPPRRRR